MALSTRHIEKEKRIDERIGRMLFVLSRKLGDKKCKYEDFIPKEKKIKTAETMALEARVFAAAFGG